MPEEAPGRVRLRLIPVVGQLDLRSVPVGATAQEHQRVAPGGVLVAPRLDEPELAHEELQRRLEIPDPQHRVKETHDGEYRGPRSVKRPRGWASSQGVAGGRGLQVGQRLAT